MSFPRLALLALGLPLLAGACGGPVAVAAVSYGADGVSLVDSGKTTTDHFASMVSKKDCAFWRVFRNQNICREREGNHDPYKVNYDIAERQTSEDGVSYNPPLHASATAPPTSWTAETYKPAPVAPVEAAAPVTPVEAATPVVAEATPAAAPPGAAKSAAPHKRAKKAKAATAPVKKASRGPAASAS